MLTGLRSPLEEGFGLFREAGRSSTIVGIYHVVVLEGRVLVVVSPGLRRHLLFMLVSWRQRLSRGGNTICPGSASFLRYIRMSEGDRIGGRDCCWTEKKLWRGFVRLISWR